MYAKIFGSLFDGSMRGEPDLILVFVNMLTRCDKNGVDDRVPRAISDEVGLSLERVDSAIQKLEGSDAYSRSRNNDGRRIELIDPERPWGWVIINYDKYRQIRKADDRRVYMQQLMQKKREKVDRVSTLLAPVSNPLAPVSFPLAMLAKGEVEGEVEVEVDAHSSKSTVACFPDGKKVKNVKKKTPKPKGKKASKINAELIAEIYSIYPRKSGFARAMKAIEKALQRVDSKTLIKRVKDYRDAVAKWRAGDEDYVPYPASWFNDSRWMDDDESWVRHYRAEPTDARRQQKKENEFTEPKGQYAKSYSFEDK